MWMKMVFLSLVKTHQIQMKIRKDIYLLMKEDIKRRKNDALIHICQCFLHDLFKIHVTCSILIKIYHASYSFRELQDIILLKHAQCPTVARLPHNKATDKLIVNALNGPVGASIANDVEMLKDLQNQNYKNE